MPEQWLRFLGINPPDVCPQNYERFYMFDPEQPLGGKIQIDKTENVVVRDVKIQAASEF